MGAVTGAQTDIAGTENNIKLPGLQGFLRQWKLTGVVQTVGQIIVGQVHRLIGAVFQLHPVVILMVLFVIVQVVKNGLVDDQSAMGVRFREQAFISLRAVIITGRSSIAQTLEPVNNDNIWSI